MSSRQQDRLRLRAARNALSAHDQKLAAQNLRSLLAEFEAFKTAKRLAYYLANDGEIDLQSSVELGREQGKSFYLPCLQNDKRMSFKLHLPEQNLIPNQYNIPEPPADTPSIDVSELDIILMPLVGFNSEGHRLGMGGGYYDRTLETISKQSNRPLFVGIAHSCQYLALIDMEKWDISMDYVITDETIWTCN